MRLRSYYSSLQSIRPNRSRTATRALPFPPFVRLLFDFCYLTQFPFGSILGRMILVTGANNRLGYEICRRLSAKGQKVRAWVPRATPPKRIERLCVAGVELFPADLHNPAVIVAAC